MRLHKDLFSGKRMPDPSLADIRSLCRERIAAIRNEIKEDTRFENRVARVVAQNLSSGRFERIKRGFSKQRPLTLVQYIDKVIQYVGSEDDRIKALEHGDADEWNRLGDFHYRRALPMVARFRRGDQAEADALDFAQDACIIIFEKRYPFDVSFEAWSTTILSRLILARYYRKSDVLNQRRRPDSLDEPNIDDGGGESPLAEMIGNPKSLAPFEKIENQTVLLNAIDQLRSAGQQDVIKATFFEELDDAQIAKRLSTTKQAVYNLRSRALARLKEILAED